MDKGFQLQAVRLQLAYLFQAEFTRQYGPPEAEPGQRLELGGRMGVELRAGVQGELWERGAHQSGKAKIGDDKGVQAGGIGRLQRPQRRPHLFLLELRVEHQVDAGAPQVRPVDGLQELRRTEVAGEGAGAEALQAQVHGVGAGRQRGTQRTLIAGRRQELDAGLGLGRRPLRRQSHRAPRLRAAAPPASPRSRRASGCGARG